jgi:hypothetical protein
MMPDMRSEPGHDQLAVGPAAPHPGSSRAGQVAVVTGVILPVDGGWTAH